MSLSIPQVKVYFFNPVFREKKRRKRGKSEDLASYPDDFMMRRSLKRQSYDCAVHLDEIPMSNNNDANESGTDDLSETDSEDERAWGVRKNYGKETYV